MDFHARHIGVSRVPSFQVAHDGGAERGIVHSRLQFSASDVPVGVLGLDELVHAESSTSIVLRRLCAPGLTLEFTPDCMLGIMASMEGFRIGQVARQTGLSVDAIRFYEKTGLLGRPARTPSGYRLFRGREVADLEFIQKAQQLGFSLREVRELLLIQQHPQEECAHVRDLIAEKLSVVRGKVEELRALEAGLYQALKECGSTLRRTRRHSARCPVLGRITGRGSVAGT